MMKAGIACQPFRSNSTFLAMDRKNRGGGGGGGRRFPRSFHISRLGRSRLHNIFESPTKHFV